MKTLPLRPGSRGQGLVWGCGWFQVQVPMGKNIYQKRKEVMETVNSVKLEKNLKIFHLLCLTRASPSIVGN